MAAVMPAVLRVEEKSPGHWSAPHPENDPEGRDVVFSGQVLGQMIMASSAAGGEKEIKSIHAIFARAGRYSAGPVELLLDPMHAGRAWASDTVTAMQGDRLLARGLVLLNAVEPDLIRHAPAMPDVAGPDQCPVMEAFPVFPDAEVREVGAAAGSSQLCVWVRAAVSSDSAAVNHAMVAWSQPGFILAAALRQHPDVVDISQAHRTISTGVISHTVHFHDNADAGEWLLFVHDGSYAGKGRVFGSGAVFTREGMLVSTFAQDSMARRVEGKLDPRTSM
jgi:acyl-CoA thioesterase